MRSTALLALDASSTTDPDATPNDFLDRIVVKLDAASLVTCTECVIVGASIVDVVFH